MEPIEVNTSSYYNEQQILKVWDVYIGNKQLSYYISESEEKKSLFDSINPMNNSKESGLLLQSPKQPYLNISGRSISICGPVDNENMYCFNGITHDLRVSLTQIKSFGLKSLKNHSILFPYHINQVHWVLGVLNLDYESDGRLYAFLKIYNSAPGSYEISDEVSSAIAKLITEILEIKKKETFKFRYKVYLTNQQNDATSSHVGSLLLKMEKELLMAIF